MIRAALLRLSLALLCLLAGLPVSAASSQAAATLSEARFWPTPCALRQGEGLPTALPDHWPQHIQQRPAQACYQLEAELSGPIDQTWAIEITRLSAHYALTLNGQLLSARGLAARQGNPRLGSTSLLVEVPPALLRPGRNQLLIDLPTGRWSRAGLSEVLLGPDHLLRPAYQQGQFFKRSLPQAINLASGLLALLILLLWRWRPRDDALFYFALLYLLGSLRNWYYYAEAPLIGPLFGDWFFYAAQVWTAALMLLFAGRLSGKSKPYQHIIILSLASLLSLLAMAMVPQATLPSLRTFSYPFLICSLPLALWWLSSAVRQAGGKALAGVGAGLAVVLICAVHDYLTLSDILGMDAVYWMPYGMPLVLASFSIYLLRRMVSALNQVELQAYVLEERVAERTRALEAANAAKTRFLAAASHDLRQPMHAISLLVGALASKLPPADFARVLDQLKAGVQAMEELLKGILDLSRLDAGGVKARPTDFALARLLEALRHSEAAHAADRGLRLRVRNSRLWVHSDPILLERMLRNLLGNALRYTESGTVLIGCRRRGRHVRIEVWDSGIGIEADQLRHVFEAFYQVANVARDRSKGLGLGLSIVEQYADLLGHRLGALSWPGRGSCFAVEVPLADAQPELPATASTRLADVAGSFVLLMEDDAQVAEATALLLRSWGCHVELAHGHAHAEQVLQGHLRLPDLLLVDYRLGAGLNGIAAIAALREALGEPIPAIVLTGDVAPAELRTMAAAGLPVLHKPIKAEALLQAMAEQLAHSSASLA